MLWPVYSWRGPKPSLNIVTGKSLPLPEIKTLLSSWQSLLSVYLPIGKGKVYPRTGHKGP
jgi:hypothetical protein